MSVLWGQERMKTILIRSAAALLLSASLAQAEEGWLHFNLFGGPGMVDMPTGLSFPDGRIGVTAGGFGPSDQIRLNLSFQVFPRLTGTLRYSRIDDYFVAPPGPILDHSFDLHYRLTDESQYIPAVAVGLRDVMGTGLYSSEYVVATKHLTDNLRITGGLGWGRMGSYNGFSNPLGSSMEVRPPRDYGLGGQFELGQLFRGDAALFGGIQYQLNDRWSFTAEYSSDAYAREETASSFVHRSPFNYGVTYTPTPGYQFSAYSLYGSEIGVSATIILDPTAPQYPSGIDRAPIPVAVRAPEMMGATTWDRTMMPDTVLSTLIAQVLETEGVTLLGMEATDTTMRVRYTNTRYRSEVQAAGRIARILTQVAPPSIETFILEPVMSGIPASSIALRRSDIEALENEPRAAQAIYDRAVISHAGRNEGLSETAANEPQFTWGLLPYLELTIFDGDTPFRGEVGLELKAAYRIRPNIVLSGAIRKQIAGNSGEGPIEPPTGDIPQVRTLATRYALEGDPALSYLTIAHYGHPAPNVYSRVTAGYLEEMFGGLSTELLWKPVDSPLAIGAELNYAIQRDFNVGFGFQDYSVLTGHVSAYYEFENGFLGQLDVGRYLAGDWGATVSLDREFENGWSVGAYFTLTDMPFDDFGEGSFDKGVRVTVPLDWATGRGRQSINAELASLSRDGGARLHVQGRLYDTIRDGQPSRMTDGWGRFWR